MAQAPWQWQWRVRGSRGHSGRSNDESTESHGENVTHCASATHPDISIGVQLNLDIKYVGASEVNV